MRIKANAKVNLSLDITGKRPDGYHTLCSVFQSVSLCDVLTIDLSDKIAVTCSRPELNGEGNLCFKAAQRFFEAARLDSGAQVYIEKHIPEAAGLGGGSADAAAVLVALNGLCNRPFTQEKLLEIALTLGADVPFCVLGGTRLCEGIGEIMTELPPLPQCHIVIAKKGKKSSTGDMYRALDAACDRRRPDNAQVIDGIKKGRLADAFKDAYNCFESVCDVSALNEVRGSALENGALYCGLSGAGPSVVSVFESGSVAENVRSELQNKGFEAFVAVPTGCGVEIIE